MTINSSRFPPQSYTLEQDLARAIPCRYCGMLVFWNSHCIFRRTGKPMLVDAVAGAPTFKQNHNCAIWAQEKEEQKYLQESLDNFIASVRPSTAIAILGSEEECVNNNNNNNSKIVINENISFMIKKKKEEKKK